VSAVEAEDLVDRPTGQVDAEDGAHEQAPAIGQVSDIVGPGGPGVGDVEEGERGDRHGMVLLA
jgi:hypothetical protein